MYHCSSCIHIKYLKMYLPFVTYDRASVAFFEASTIRNTMLNKERFTDWSATGLFCTLASSNVVEIEFSTGSQLYWINQGWWPNTNCSDSNAGIIKTDSNTWSIKMRFNITLCKREGSGSVVKCLTWDWGVAGSSLTIVTALSPSTQENQSGHN